MIRLSLLILLTALLLLGLTSAGCASRNAAADHDERPDPWSFGPATDPGNAGNQVRSLTFDTPEHRELVATQPWLADAQPTSAWYYDRNDRRNSVVAGYESSTVEVSHTFTRDRQSSRDGRVYDNFDSTTYRSSTTTTVR